jgi:hypothetical protein
MNNENYVWYASYGSNLNQDRFMCYIRGGTPEGSSQMETGCRDQEPPIKDKAVSIPYPLYFAKSSTRWSDGGVAFLGLQEDKEQISLGRMYLVTREQFIDIVRQENDGIEIEINFEKVKEKGSAVIADSWYGNIVYLGENDDYPIFTFTAPWDIHEVEVNAPSKEYLTTIIKGMREVYDDADEEIVNYFSRKEGIIEKVLSEM